MFKLDTSKSFKTLYEQIDRNELPDEIAVNLEKVSVTKGIDEVTGNDKEVKSLFETIEKHFPKALEPVVEGVDDLAAALDIIDMLMEGETDPEKLAELNEAIEIIDMLKSSD